MQPQQPYYQQPSPPPQDTNQYDFIVNHGTTPSGPSRQSIILFVVGGALLIIVLAWIILSLAFGSSQGGATTALVTIAQEQTEMIHLTKLANDSNHLSSQDTRNFSRNVTLSLSSDNAQLVTFLAKHGKKLNNKQLSLKQSATTDNTLSAAEASGTYDSTLTSILQSQLTTYQNDLKQAYGSAKSTTEKSLLQSEFNNATLLLQQSSQHS